MTLPRIMMIGGPNLDRLGSRDPDIYGKMTWPELQANCLVWAKELDLALDFPQTDSEGEMVGWVHEAGDKFQGLILNAAGYTHTSVAVRDAVEILNIPIVELHLSNPDAREPFRRQNMLADVVTAGIRGLGAHGYRLALEGIKSLV